MRYNLATLRQEVLNFRNIMCDAKYWNQDGTPNQVLTKCFGVLIAQLLPNFEGTSDEKRQAEVMIDTHSMEFRRRMELMMQLKMRQTFSKVAS